MVRQNQTTMVTGQSGQNKWQRYFCSFHYENIMMTKTSKKYFLWGSSSADSVNYILLLFSYQNRYFDLLLLCFYFQKSDSEIVVIVVALQILIYLLFFNVLLKQWAYVHVISCAICMFTGILNSASSLLCNTFESSRQNQCNASMMTMNSESNFWEYIQNFKVGKSPHTLCFLIPPIRLVRLPILLPILHSRPYFLFYVFKLKTKMYMFFHGDWFQVVLS